MDKKRQLLKGQNRRSSPRLKGETLSNTSTTLTKQEQTKTESRPNVVPSQSSTPTSIDNAGPNDEIGAPSQTEPPFTPPVVSSIKVIEHRTPERKPGVSTPPSTSMKRELRKIEDYWTRQEPVQSDSPRLRCHKRKALSNNATPTQKQTSGHDYEPGGNVEILQGDKSNDTEFLPESPIPTLDKKEMDNTRMQSAADKTHLIVLSPFKKLNGDSVDNAYKEQLVSGTEEPDDEEYLPPRKKLRSEVKQDELWEGIPLTVSFKRLTPLLKRTDDQTEKDARPIEMNEDLDNGEQECSETESNLEGIQTDALPEYPGFEMKSMECASRHDLEQFEAGIRKQVKKAKVTTPIMKRSARLQQKNSITPIKSTSNLDTNERNIFETTSVQKSNDKINDTTPTPNEDAPEELIDGLENEASPISLDKVKADECKALNSSDIANMSISQILTCDSQSSLYDENVPDVASTVEIELDSTMLYDKDDNTNIDIVTVNTTIELSNDDDTDILVKADNVTKSICSQESNKADKSDKSDDQKEGCAILKFGKSYKKQKKQPSKPNSQPVSSLDKTETEENKQSKVTSKTAIGKGNTVFTLIKETKFGKSKNVPPLKIRLKNTNRSKRRKCWRVNTNTEEESCNDSTTAESVIQSNVESIHKSSTSEESKNELEESTPNEGGKNNNAKKTQIATPDTLKTKTKKRSGNKKELKKWSPPSNVNLRLNSERRLSMVNGLLSNKVLNNHACVIWSSENRRHMQLSHPDCSTSELDELLREKWSQLAEKEKVRYFQRAWDASKDENKHSTRRQESHDVSEKQPANSSIERFLAMDSKTQHTEIKHWLQFFSEVSHTAYNNVINQFRASLQAEKQEQDQTVKECKSRTKTKKNKSKKQKQKASEADADAKHRRLMFETILKNRQDILETWAEKKESQAQLLRDNFDSLVRKLVAGEDVDFTPTIKSTRLAEALHDLRDLEKDKRLVVSGEETNGESYAALLNEVDVYLKERKRPSALLDSLGDECVNQETVEEYLRVTNKLDEHKMPILNAVAIKQVLDDVRHRSRHHEPPLSIYRKHVTLSPPSMLTEWVTEDVIRVNPNVGFRSAVSLLSNKVHPSPAFVTPTLTDHVSVTSSAGQRKMQSLLMTNTNQNCYKTVTYTFTRDRNTNPIISKLKRCSQGYNNGRDKSS